MMTRRSILLSVCLLCFLGPSLAEDRNYLLATASTGGTYYPVGVALATLIKVKVEPEHHIGLSAINSAGSGENVKLLRDDEVQFAILQGLFGYYAWRGEGPFKEQGPQRGLRAISMLWQNVEQFIIESEYAKSGTIADMRGLNGKKMALGKKNSGTIGSNRTLLRNLGIDMDNSYDLVYLGYGPSAAALQDGKVAGISTPAGTPTGAVTRAMAAMGDEITLLAFTDEDLAKADGGTGLWSRYLIKAGTYPGQDEDISTIAQPNFLAVRADVDEQAVYLITKAMYENLSFLHGIHKATRAMSLEHALDGLPMPLHPGAVRYYREVGIDIPKRLLAD